MKKSLIALATTVVLASSLVSTTSVARGFPGRGGERPENIQAGQVNQQGEQPSEQHHGSGNLEHRLLRLTRILNLSDDQITVITSIQDSQKEPMARIKEDMKSARESLKALIQADIYDEEAIATIAATIGLLVTELTVLKSKGKFDIYQVLTDEQQVSLEELIHVFGGHRNTPPTEVSERPVK